MVIFLWILLIIASLVLQTTLLSPERLGGTRIDLVLLLTIFAGLYGGAIKGGMTGFLGGLLGDSLSGGVLGIGTLSKTVAGSFSGFVGAKLYQKNILVQLIVSFLSILIHELIYLCLMFFYRVSLPLLSVVVRVTVLTIVVNTLLAPPFFWGIRRIFKIWRRYLSPNLGRGEMPPRRKRRKRHYINRINKVSK